MDPIPYGARRAIDELTAIASCQWANGMLPQIRFMRDQHGYRPDADDWGVTPAISGPTALRTSGITQPPVMGLCLAEVARKAGAAVLTARAAEFVRLADAFTRYHEWLLRERDPWGESLVLCLHPWETGTDNSPAFDPLIDATRAYIEARDLPVESFGRADTVHVKQEHRPTQRDYFAYFGLLTLFKRHAYDQAAIIAESPFLLQDVLFNSVFVASLRDLAALQDDLAALPALAGDAGRLQEQAARAREQADAVAAAIRAKLWDPQTACFYSYDSHGARLLRTPTVACFMPLMAGIADTGQTSHLMDLLRDPDAFATPVPIPSTAANALVFNSLRYWSGPSWPVTNWLVLRGLRERGLPEAGSLRARTLRMIAEGARPEQARRAAIDVLERHSFGEAFTTPSRQQYAHAWLWDSAIVAASWPLVGDKPAPAEPQPGAPGFWEYYEPATGEPLGAAPMTWTASLYLELLAMRG
jgi:hypothetical protein